MIETINLIFGILLLLVGIYDFFFTTLSGSGAGFLSKNISYYSYKVIHFFVDILGRRVFAYSGLLVNLMVLVIWILLVWIGLYLVYSSNPEFIMNEKGRAADNWERLYFTGYTISTLGLGDFTPKIPAFHILTSCFSFFGFIFFTSSITYFISLSSAVINKRVLAKNIYNLGSDPVSISRNLLALNPGYAFNLFKAIQELVDRHAVNHEAYPVIHFYGHPQPEICLSLNLTRLDEALSILTNSGNAENLQKEMEPLRNSITSFLNYINNNFSRSLPTGEYAPETFSLPYQVEGIETEYLQHRRKILEGLLKSESFTWKDVINNQA